MATALRPSLSKIIERITADAEARYDQEFLRRSDMKTYIRVLAGASHELYSAVEYGRKQLFTETAESSYLERRGRLFDIYRKEATKATGTVAFDWSSPVAITQGTVIQTTDGYQYELTEDVHNDGTATVQALIAGATYNIEQGTEFALVSAISGVSGATATTAITGGTDAEDDESLRARVLERTQNPPRTGTAEDYVQWAHEVAGVTRAWCFPREMGIGTVTVRFMTDGLTEDGFPTAEKIAEVQAYLESKADVLAVIYAVAPVAQSVNFTLSITPDNVTMRQRAEQALKELFFNEAVPGGKIYLSHINAAISAVSEEEDHVIVSPAADITADSNVYMLTLGSVTWEEN